ATWPTSRASRLTTPYRPWPKASNSTTGAPHLRESDAQAPRGSSSRSTRGASTRSSACARRSATRYGGCTAARTPASPSAAFGPARGGSSRATRSTACARRRNAWTGSRAPGPDSRRVERLLEPDEGGQDDVETGQGPAFERLRLSVARDRPHGDRRQCERAGEDRIDDKRQPVREEERHQHEYRVEEDGDLRNRVLDHGQREVVLALRGE